MDLWKKKLPQISRFIWTNWYRGITDDNESCQLIFGKELFTVKILFNITGIVMNRLYDLIDE